MSRTFRFFYAIVTILLAICVSTNAYAIKYSVNVPVLNLRSCKGTNCKIVAKLTSGEIVDVEDNIDNYYHPLLQCELAKISPESRRNGIALGYAKEYLMDYPKKRFLQHYNHNEIMEDSKKNLQNNLYGSNLGYYNPNTSCEDLLDDRRTPNMRKLGIR